MAPAPDPSDTLGIEPEPMPIESLLLPSAPGEPVPLEELLLPDTPSPRKSVGRRMPPPASRARRSNLVPAGLGLALVVAAVGAARLLAASRSPGDAPPVVPTATAPPPPPAAAPAPVAGPSAPAADARLHGGRSAEWWRQRLALLSGASDPEGRRLHAVTLQRAIRLGIVPADATQPVGGAAEGGAVGR